MKNNTLNTSHVTELLYQALETEKGGVQIYTTALRCALNEDLKEEWNKYLEQTKTHVQVVSDILKGMNLDPEVETPGPKNRSSHRRFAGAGDGDGVARARSCGGPDRRGRMRDARGNQRSSELGTDWRDCEELELATLLRS